MPQSQTSPTSSTIDDAARPWWQSPYLMLVLPPALWAGNAIAGRIVAGEISPLALSVVRWSLAILLLLPFTVSGVLTQWPVVRRRWKSLAMLGIFSAGLYNLLLYMALQTTTAINVTLVNSAMPMTIVLVSWIWLRDKPSVGAMAGIVLSMVGVAVVVSRGDLAVLLGLELHQGDMLMLLAVLVWALYSVMLRAHPPGLTPNVFLTVQMSAGLLFLIPFYGVELAGGGGAVPLTWTMVAVLAYVSTGPAIGAFYFWNRGVAETGANTAGLYINLLPVFTAILAVFMLGEVFQWYHAAGLALIFTGIALGTIRRRR